MRYCPNCGNPIPDDARFCGRCGSDLQPLQGGQRTQRSNNNGNHAHGRGQSAASSFVDHLNEYVGNDRPADLNWRMLFTDVFKSHTVEEAEDIFICGTHATTATGVERVAETMALQPRVPHVHSSLCPLVALLQPLRQP